MSATESPLAGPDLSNGIPASELRDGATLLGHVGEDAVLLVSKGGEIFAINNTCTHYSGPLNEGLVRGETIHCPWHHACFDLRTGRAHAPALTALTCWKVERDGELLRVREKLAPAAAAPFPGPVSSVVIVGAGAAGHAAAETLRAEGYQNPVHLIGGENSGPVDRPNLSKDYLAGQAPAEWIPLRPREFYAESKISLTTDRAVTAIRPDRKEIEFADGSRMAYGALLLATGASPVKLPVPGAGGPNVYYLRSLADSDAIIAAAASAKNVVVIGSSFIGLEVAASLRMRGLGVAVVAPESTPLEKVLGASVGAAIRTLHESHGVAFHLGRKPASIGERAVTLDDGKILECDFVVMGVGVRPNLELAEKAGLQVDKGVLVNQFLQTSSPDIYAAGDIARWTSPIVGEPVRIEHWAVAQRQGQAAARNILGRKQPYSAVPFFWSAHYDRTIRYCGVGVGFTDIAIDGDPASAEWTAVYRKGDRVIAVATQGRDLVNLKAEAAFENDDQDFLRSLA